MAVETLKSVQLTNADATPVVVNDAALVGGRVRSRYGQVTLPASSSSGSTAEMVRIPIDSTPLYALVYGDGTTNLTNIDVGAKLVHDTPQLDDDSWVVAIAVGTAVTFSAPKLIAGKGTKAWEYTGASSRPNDAGEVAIEISLDANATAVGDLYCAVFYALD